MKGAFVKLCLTLVYANFYPVLDLQPFVLFHDYRNDWRKRWFILSASPDADLQEVKIRVYDDDYDQLVIDARIGEVAARPSGWRPVYDRIIHERDYERRQRDVDFRIDLRLEVVVRYNKRPSADDELQPIALRSSATLSRDLDQLLQSGGSADFTFEVEGEEIPAHKIILSSRSSYFRALFNSGRHRMIPVLSTSMLF